MIIEIGMKIEDRYQIMEQLGEDTFTVKNISSGSKWILKAMNMHVESETIQMLQMIRHPSLPRIFETFVLDGRSYFLLEFIEGQNLIEICAYNDGKLSCSLACEYMAVISRTLYFLHSQNHIAILHLDVKPENIILSKNKIPCLIDYGTARMMTYAKPEDGNNDYAIYGTPGYTPPEMLQGNPPTEQCDIFMMGMTLLRLITGTEPDPSWKIDIKKLNAAVPSPVLKIILRCIMSNPADRYGNASELACDLEALYNTTLCYEILTEQECSQIPYVQETSHKKIFSLSDVVPVNYIERKAKTKNRILCVWDNSQFAVELASVLARQNNKVLIIDVNLLSPSIDMLLEVRDNLSQSNRSLLGTCSLSDLMEEYSKKRLNTETIRMFSQRTAFENLSCISGNYRMEDYEYYSTEGLAAIIKCASLGFDQVVLSCGRFIYDEFTCVSQLCADVVFIPIIANSLEFREFNRYIHFLTGRKQLEKRKILYVGYDYHTNEDLSHGTCNELCDGAFIGVVSYSAKRRMMTGSKKSYVNAMESKIEKQYKGIIKKAMIMDL